MENYNVGYYKANIVYEKIKALTNFLIYTMFQILLEITEKSYNGRIMLSRCYIV